MGVNHNLKGNIDMALAKDKLAESLEELRNLQKKNKSVVFRAGELSRIHRERLQKEGYVQEVMQGWYISDSPDRQPGESTVWYVSYWDFCAQYLKERFSNKWTVSPEQSLSFISGNWTIPTQLIVKSPKGQNNVTNLLFGTSILDLRQDLPKSNQIKILKGMRHLSLPYAIINCTQRYYKSDPTDARTALLMIKDISDILGPLLEGGHSVIAGKIAGAFRNIGKDFYADEIIKTFKSAGYTIRETDPFKEKLSKINIDRAGSPYVPRINLLWQEMRDHVIKVFPKPPKIVNDIDSYLKKVDEIYKTDAYNSLSIEGYQVTEELINRVKSGNWDPENHKSDLERYNALAARGYWQAFQSVKESLTAILSGGLPGKVVATDFRDWYRELFQPLVTAGLLLQSDLAGFRNQQVFIRHSRHVPLSSDAVRDAMPALFQLLEKEENSAVRAVLGHFFFVYIHPYKDGNGRIARFLMNSMLASGGYLWTVIPLQRRKEYMDSLEEASINQNIKPFAEFVAGLVKEGMQ